MKINLITVCTDTYPMEYARKIVKRLQQLSDFDIEPYCLTDRPEEINDICNTIATPFKAAGWWNKMFIYNKDMPEGWNLYLDLDIVLIENFDEELQWVIDQDKPLACVSDAIKWMNNKYSSSMVLLKSKDNHDIYEAWTQKYKELETFAGGDQVWTGWFLRENNKEVLYIDEQFKKIKYNLKYHLAQSMSQQGIQLPREVPPGVKMIDCGGRPKPHEMESIPYIKQNWHDI